MEDQARAGLIQWIQIKTLDEPLHLPAVTGSADAMLIHSSLMDGVKRGEISEERIDQSVYRISEMKSLLQIGPDWAGDPDAVGSADHLEVRKGLIDA